MPGFGTLADFFPTKEQLFQVLVVAFASSASFSDSGNYSAKVVPVREEEQGSVEGCCKLAAISLQCDARDCMALLLCVRHSQLSCVASPLPLTTTCLAC